MARAALPASGSCSLELRQLLSLGGSCASAFGAYPNAGSRPGVTPALHICNGAQKSAIARAPFICRHPFFAKEPKVPAHRPQEEAPVHGGSAVAPEPPPAAPGSAPLPRAVAAAEVWVCAPCLASAPGGRKENHMRAPAGLLLAANPLCFSSSLCEIRYNFGNRALSVNLRRA